MRPAASVIVRTKDKAATVEATMVALRRQNVPVEVVVVDSGSTDGTLDIARRYADKVICIRPEEFSYGGALNIGAEAASADVHMALSAHCVPLFDNWVELSLSLHAARADVAGTNQASHTPRGDRFDPPYFLRVQDAREHPAWGFSNHASSWRADVWREMPFREDLPACEDKEWSWRVLAAGWTIAFHPGLAVPAGHRRDAGVRELWRRCHKEGRALAELGAVPWPSYRELAVRWWTDRPPLARRSQALRRINPYRLAELHGTFVGSRTSRRLPGPTHGELTRS